LLLRHGGACPPFLAGPPPNNTPSLFFPGRGPRRAARGLATASTSAPSEAAPPFSRRRQTLLEYISFFGSTPSCRRCRCCPPSSPCPPPPQRLGASARKGGRRQPRGGGAHTRGLNDTMLWPCFSTHTCAHIIFYPLSLFCRPCVSRLFLRAHQPRRPLGARISLVPLSPLAAAFHGRRGRLPAVGGGGGGGFSPCFFAHLLLPRPVFCLARFHTRTRTAHAQHERSASLNVTTPCFDAASSQCVNNSPRNDARA
jgi:hypothetical protein